MPVCTPREKLHCTNFDDSFVKIECANEGTYHWLDELKGQPAVHLLSY